jgi:hypothetical protein
LALRRRMRVMVRGWLRVRGRLSVSSGRWRRRGEGAAAPMSTAERRNGRVHRHTAGIYGPTAVCGLLLRLHITRRRVCVWMTVCMVVVVVVCRGRTPHHRRTWRLHTRQGPEWCV